MAFQFRLSSAIHRARRLGHAQGVRLTLPGVDFAGEVPGADRATWQLLLSALDRDEIRAYWHRSECCEGCAELSRAAIHQIEALVRLTRSAIGADASPASAVLLTALDEGMREYRDFVRQFTPDIERHIPWGSGSRDDYLRAMHLLRAHLKQTLHQIGKLLSLDVHVGSAGQRQEGWTRGAYVIFNEPAAE